MKGETYTCPFRAPRVAAYTAAACSCEKAERHVDAHSRLHRLLGRLEPFPRRRELHVRVRDPGEHFLSLPQHRLSRGRGVGIDLDGHRSLRDQAADGRDDVAIKIKDFPGAEFLPFLQAGARLGILGNQA